MATVLALDVGSSSVRAQCFDEQAEPVDELRQERYTGSDPSVLVELVRRVIAGRDESVDVVGMSCFGHSLLALDDHGRTLTEVLGWRDTRSAAAAESLRATLDPAAVHARTGAELHPAFWPAKLAWLAESQPEVFGAAAQFVSFSDHLRAELVGGPPRTSVSMASGTGLHDLTTGGWDAELLGVLGLDEARLPAIADEPVWIDGACSNLGTGCTTPTRAALSIGTSGALRILHAPDPPRPRRGLFCYRLDERRVVEGGALSDGGNLVAWLDATLRDGGDEGRDDHGLTFLTLLGGERSPGWDPEATGAIAGLTFATTAADIRRSGLEGVAFRFAAVAALLPEVEEVVASGGAVVADPAWVQIIADALDRPVTASAVAEASLRGAAVAILERLGHEAATAPLGDVFQPREARAEAYRFARELQQRLYEELRGHD